MRSITLADGGSVAALGRGTWHMGERGANRKPEVTALRAGLDLGLTLIDTAEMYAEAAECRRAIAGRRRCSSSQVCARCLADAQPVFTHINRTSLDLRIH